MSTFNKPEMTPLLSEKKLAVLLWVITGGKGTDISQLTLLSSCSRATQMHDDLFINIKEFLKKMKPHEAAHYEHLMSNDRLMYCLVDEIGFSTKTIDESKIPEYFSRAESNLDLEIKEMKKSLNEEVEKLTLALEKEKSQREKALQILQTKVKEAESAKSNLHQLNLLMESEQEKLRQIEAKNKQIIETPSAIQNEEELIALRSIEKNMKTFLRRTLKAIIFISMAYTIYKLNNITSLKISDTEIGKETIKTVAIILSFCFTWFLPDLLFKKVTEVASEKIIYLFKSK